jgi:hypothetical protein
VPGANVMGPKIINSFVTNRIFQNYGSEAQRKNAGLGFGNENFHFRNFNPFLRYLRCCRKEIVVVEWKSRMVDHLNGGHWVVRLKVGDLHT